jgi:hypothetical protein
MVFSHQKNGFLSSPPSREASMDYPVPEAV